MRTASLDIIGRQHNIEVMHVSSLLIQVQIALITSYNFIKLMRASRQQIHTILELHQNPNDEATLVGIVLDASGQLKTKTGQVFQKIKLVDETWNHHQLPPQNWKPYLHVFNFVKDASDLVPIEQVGDAVVLKRFSYKNYDSEFQALKHKHRNPRVNVIDGLTNEIKFGNAINDEELLGRIDTIRQWARKYFAEYSLLQMSWFNKQDDKPYDLLLRIKTRTLNQLILMDQEGNTFQLNVGENQIRKLRVGQMIKIRDVKVINSEIVVNETSNLLIVPDYFYDHNTVQMNTVKQENLQEKLLTCTDYQLHPTPLLELMSHKPDGIVQVTGQIIDIAPKKLGDALSIYFYSTSESYTFNQLKLSPVIDEDKQDIVFHLKVGLRDDSLAQSPHVQVLNLITNDIDPYFDLKDVTIDNYDKYEPQFQDKVLNLLKLSDQGLKSTFLIEKIGECYRIIDTYFN